MYIDGNICKLDNVCKTYVPAMVFYLISQTKWGVGLWGVGLLQHSCQVSFISMHSIDIGGVEKTS